MRFRAGLVTGFAAGFYVGALAGRERYHQINRLVRRAKRSGAADAVRGRVRSAVGVTGGHLGLRTNHGHSEMAGARLVPADRDL